MFFIILSGYADFQYAQEAIKYTCTDYILKPVEKDKLIQALRKVRGIKNIKLERDRETKKLENAYLARTLISIIQGRFDTAMVEYVRQHIRLSKGIRYVEILIDGNDYDGEFEDTVSRANQILLYKTCIDYLQDDSGHCVMDVSIQEKVYDVGFLLCRYMYESSDIKEYLENFMKYLREMLGLQVIMIVGKSKKSGRNSKVIQYITYGQIFSGIQREKRISITMKKRFRSIPLESCSAKIVWIFYLMLLNKIIIRIS